MLFGDGVIVLGVQEHGFLVLTLILVLGEAALRVTAFELLVQLHARGARFVQDFDRVLGYFRLEGRLFLAYAVDVVLLVFLVVPDVLVKSFKYIGAKLVLLSSFLPQSLGIPG